MADLMKRLVKQNIAVDYIGKIMAVFREDINRSKPGGGADEHISPAPQDRMAPPRQPNFDSMVDPLTRRELDVVELLEQRLSNKEIAGKLFISPKTVKKHLDNIYGKLNVSNRRQAVEKSVTLGILPSP